MHVLIDAGNAAAIAVSAEYSALSGLSVIQYANTDTIIVPLIENKGFSQFEHAQLIGIAASVGLTLPPSTAYPSLLKQTREAILAAEWLRFPFTKEQVDAQVATLEPGYDQPLYFNPNGDTPLPATMWHVSPQRNRKRQDASYWVHYASGWLQSATGSAGGGRDAAQPPPAARPSKRPSARAVAPPAPGGTTPAPKPRPAPSGPATRPKAGSSTGRVWDIADEESAKYGAADRTGKEVRRVVIARCEAEGINPSTASVQFGKWKSSQ